MSVTTIASWCRARHSTKWLPILSQLARLLVGRRHGCHPCATRIVLAPLQERLTGLHVGQHSVAGSSLGSGSAGRPAGRASVPAASRSRSSFAAACRRISLVAAQPLARASPARRMTDRGVG